MVCYHQNIHQDIGLMAFGPTILSYHIHACVFVCLTCA